MAQQNSHSGGTVPIEAVRYFGGQTLAGKYQLEREIGAGAMGSVWLATHLTLGQRVAIKLISQEYAFSREARARFDNEAKAAAQLRSRFVVQVYDNGETEDGTPYIVMEYLEGESLEGRLQRAGAMGVDECVRVVSQVARALERAHALGIVHRDLKPANIFLARSLDDDAIIAKVLDFGVAKMTHDETSTTRTGSVIGTPQFMSPEQVRGLKTVDHRSDLYALGVITYTMLTGRLAFNGEAFGDLLLAICTQPLPSIHSENPSLPPSLDGWFYRACARDPDQRFQTGGDLIDMLVVAAGLGASARDVPELVPGPSTFQRSGSSGGFAPGQPEVVPVAPPQGAWPGTDPGLAMGVGMGETVGTAIVPAGVPQPASIGKILAVVFGLMLLGGIGVGAAVLLYLRTSGGEDSAKAPASAPTAPAAAPAADVPAPSPVPAVTASATPPSVTPLPGPSPQAAPAPAAPQARPVPVAARQVAKAVKEVAKAAKPAPAPAPAPAAPAPAPAPAPKPRPRVEPDVGF